MAKTVLLAGRTNAVVKDAQDKAGRPDVRFLAATTIDEVRSAFAETRIDHVIIGGGLDLADRIDIVRSVFTLSDGTTVHLKDVESGPEGFVPFVRSVLSGLAGQPPSHHGRHQLLA